MPASEREAGGLARELLQVPIKDDRQDADAHIRDRGQQERCSDAECRYQMEAGSIGSQDRTERIQAYNRPTCPPRTFMERTKNRLRTGSVAPMRVVGIRRVRKMSRNWSRLKAKKDNPNARWRGM